MESDISLRALDFCKYKGITAADFERICGLANGMLKKLGENTRKQTYIRISNAFPELNVDWLRTGDGEMIHKFSRISQYGDHNILQQGRAGHTLNQTNNSEKLFLDYIGSLQSQTKLVERSMEQTDKAFEQMGKALDELSENRKLIDRLILMIENKK